MELDKLKRLLEIAFNDTPQDTNLAFIMDDIKETILNYCNLNHLPPGLQNTAYRRAIDLHRNEAVGEGDAFDGIASIKEGDTQTNFNKAVDENFKFMMLKNYTAQLNRYRKFVVSEALDKVRKYARGSQKCMYDGKCTVIEYGKTKDPITKITSKGELIVLEEATAQLSFSLSPAASKTSTTANLTQAIRLFGRLDQTRIEN